MNPYHVPVKPPWKLHEHVVCNEQVMGCKRDYNPEYLKLIFLDHINLHHSDSVQIYTDESRTDIGTGGAYYMHSEQENFKLSNKASIFTAEIYDILKVLQVIERNNRNYDFM